MKKVILSLTIISLLTLVIIVSCKKTGNDSSSYTCNTCKQAPDAVAANDANSKGIYKGVVIGSSGTIKFNVANSDNTITATMVIDGVTVTLTSSITWVQGQSYVAPFTGTLNGSAVSINFKVDANGGNPIITSSNIPGHPNADFTLVKETSSALIECFEGTYHSSLPEDGTFNLLLSRSLKQYGGSARKNGSTVASSTFNGSINGNNDLVDAQDNQVKAHLSGDILSGNSKDRNGNTITVNAKRTL
ncbi:MAG: hypothetical protein J0I09_06220 [Sphingobacteriia bacterium]|nr:hypothetical protein [Sphingobacteriia bacterium]